MHTINTTPYNIRTDLIIEKEYTSISNKEKIIGENYSIERLIYNGKKYTTISYEDITDKDNYKSIEKVFIKELKLILKEYNIQKNEQVIIVGLGNSNSTPDSLGPKTLEHILVTSHLYKLGDVEDTYQNVSILKPDVTGITGIETKDIIEAVIRKTSAKLVIAIDALAASCISRVNKTIQITNNGILPGSGVGNNREALDESSLSIPVIAIGVPTIVEASTIVVDTIEYLKQHISYLLSNKDAKDKLIPTYLKDYSDHDTNLSESQKNEILGELGTLTKIDLKQLLDEVLVPIKYNLMVTPKEIDYLIDKIALLLGTGINKVLHEDFNPTK